MDANTYDNDPSDAPPHPFLGNEWMAVSSSWIREARYDRAAQTLWLRTDKGPSGGYAYESVPPELALAFWESGSKGRWIWNHYPPRSRR